MIFDIYGAHLLSNTSSGVGYRKSKADERAFKTARSVVKATWFLFASPLKTIFFTVFTAMSYTQIGKALACSQSMQNDVLVCAIHM